MFHQQIAMGRMTGTINPVFLRDLRELLFKCLETKAHKGNEGLLYRCCGSVRCS